MRFERYVNVMDPSFKVYAPWRDPVLLEEFPGRSQMLPGMQKNCFFLLFCCCFDVFLLFTVVYCRVLLLAACSLIRLFGRRMLRMCMCV